MVNAFNQKKISKIIKTTFLSLVLDLGITQDALWVISLIISIILFNNKDFAIITNVMQKEQQLQLKLLEKILYAKLMDKP